MLETKNLARAFQDPGRGRVEAVVDLSLKVERSEIYGLLGPNGAGKTTTLRMLATLLKPDGGQIWLDGVDARAEPVKARSRIAYVPAEAGLPEQLTARETVELFAGVQGVSEPGKRAGALLESIGAGRYADTPCRSLSTGMKRRVVLARALVHDPPVLLLDEPTDGLDVSGRREILALVRELASQGRSVLVSSHIMGEVEALCSRIGVMNGGKIAAEGSVKDLLNITGTTDLGDAFMALVEDSPDAAGVVVSADEAIGG
jgi:sodium transport system ATP-binding protein